MTLLGCPSSSPAVPMIGGNSDVRACASFFLRSGDAVAKFQQLLLRGEIANNEEVPFPFSDTLGDVVGNWESAVFGGAPRARRSPISLLRSETANAIRPMDSAGSHGRPNVNLAHGLIA